MRDRINEINVEDILCFSLSFFARHVRIVGTQSRHRLGRDRRLGCGRFSGSLGEAPCPRPPPPGRPAGRTRERVPCSSQSKQLLGRDGGLGWAPGLYLRCSPATRSGRIGARRHLMHVEPYIIGARGSAGAPVDGSTSLLKRGTEVRNFLPKDNWFKISPRKHQSEMGQFPGRFP